VTAKISNAGVGLKVRVPTPLIPDTVTGEPGPNETILADAEVTMLAPSIRAATPARIGRDLHFKMRHAPLFGHQYMPTGSIAVALDDNLDSTVWTNAGGVDTAAPPAVPEPASLNLLSAGLIGLGILFPRRRWS
jgi:hypothetical protein